MTISDFKKKFFFKRRTFHLGLEKKPNKQTLNACAKACYQYKNNLNKNREKQRNATYSVQSRLPRV